MFARNNRSMPDRKMIKISRIEEESTDGD